MFVVSSQAVGGTSRRAWAIAVALALFASACGGLPEAESTGPGGTPVPGVPGGEDGTVRAQGYERQGYERQGYALHGYEGLDGGAGEGAAPLPILKGFSFKSLAAPGLGTYSVHDFAQLEEGTLEVRRSQLSGTTASLTPCLLKTSGLARSCGWKSGGVGLCSPGVTVTVATGACGLGQGTGDTMLRVCSGFGPCESGSSAMLGANDDACGGLAASVSFKCPGSGVFAVLVAPYSAASTLDAVPAASNANVYPFFNTVRTGEDLVGSSVEARTLDGGVLTMRIAAMARELDPPVITPNPYGYYGNTWRYQVEGLRDGQWMPLCGPDPFDEKGLPMAIPVSGWWDTRGGRNEDPDLFTFSCGRGVITKCYRWGYRPWDWRATQAAGVSPMDLHQACTRMARADYCGDGRSWTQSGTLINLWDTASIQQRDDLTPAPPGFSFEAGWRMDGAVCLDHKRWSYAPDDVFYKGCPKLFDITQHPDGTVTWTPRYCDDANAAKDYTPQPLFYNESAENHFP